MISFEDPDLERIRSLSCQIRIRIQTIKLPPKKVMRKHPQKLGIYLTFYDF